MKGNDKTSDGNVLHTNRLPVGPYSQKYRLSRREKRVTCSLKKKKNY